jgi:hypothetical protein
MTTTQPHKSIRNGPIRPESVATSTVTMTTSTTLKRSLSRKMSKSCSAMRNQNYSTTKRKRLRKSQQPKKTLIGKLSKAGTIGTISPKGNPNRLGDAVVDAMTAAEAVGVAGNGGAANRRGVAVVLDRKNARGQNLTKNAAEKFRRRLLTLRNPPKSRLIDRVEARRANGEPLRQTLLAASANAGPGKNLAAIRNVRPAGGLAVISNVDLCRRSPSLRISTMMNLVLEFFPALRSRQRLADRFRKL